MSRAQENYRQVCLEEGVHFIETVVCLGGSYFTDK